MHHRRPFKLFVFACALLLPRAAFAQLSATPAALRAPRFDGGLSDSTSSGRNPFSRVPFDGPRARHREPLVAGLLGVVPGLGHVYAGENRRALIVFGVFMASANAAFSSTDETVTGAGAVVMLGAQVFSIADAALAAGRFNRRHAAPPPRAATDSTRHDH